MSFFDQYWHIGDLEINATPTNPFSPRSYEKLPTLPFLFNSPYSLKYTFYLFAQLRDPICTNLIVEQDNNIELNCVNV